MRLKVAGTLVRITAFFLLVPMLLMSCASEIAPQTGPPPAIRFGDATVVAAVVHAGEGGGYWRDTLSRLEQSTSLGLEVVEIDTGRSLDFAGVDVMYLDRSVMDAENAGQARDAVTAFVGGGGYLFLTNEFYEFFDRALIGAERFEKISGCPVELEYPEVGEGLAQLQDLLADFAYLYADFLDYSELSAYDYGYGVVPSSARVLARYGGLALYTLNDYGAGKVFFTNPLLPNGFAITGFSLEARDTRQKSLADTTASFNRLLEGRFAGYKMQNLNGYSVERVFGPNGTPAMSWELHFEEITGIINNAAKVFGELCLEYGQIPSYTLIRNTYWWFLRAESVTYLLGGRDGGFLPDEYENAYASGTHIPAGQGWLALSRIENAGSYFADQAAYTQSAYPAVLDLDGDGVTDIVSGSSDGYFYFYQGQAFTDRLHTAPAVRLADIRGEAIRLQSDSAPVFADVNADGLPDLVSGSGDGKIYWFSGGPEMTYEYEGLLCQLKLAGRTLPDIADLDGDGKLDVVVGSAAGELVVCYGEQARGVKPGRTETYAVPAEIGHWLAPWVRAPGRLLAGTFEGYVAELSLGGGRLTLDGYLTGPEANFRGNFNLLFGNNCVPRLADLNGDQTPDLLAGSLEYGLAYPIDSPYFPYRAELERAVAYITENRFYLGPHFYTREYASPAREREELVLQREAMRAYGLSFEGLGTNQHTWFSSGLSPAQTLFSAWEAGLLWNSGFAPGGSAGAAPEINAKNVLALPFFLTRDGARTLLVANCSTVLYAQDCWTALSAKYGMPISLYYHCDLAYADTEAARRDIEKAEAFRRKHGYSFVAEDQMMYASAAALNLQVAFSAGDNGFSVAPYALSQDFPLYDPRYQNACGVKIIFRWDIDPSHVRTDASVWRVEGNALYVSLDRVVNVYDSSDGRSSPVARVNLPADITLTDGGAEIAFSDGGLMEAAVYGQAHTTSEGWAVRQDGGLTVFVKTGEPQTLTIRY